MSLTFTVARRGRGHGAGRKNRGKPKKKKTPFCKVCFDSGKTEAEYSSHFLKDKPGPNGTVVCPTLLAHECRQCHGKGHYKSHCPRSAQPTKERDNRFKRREPRRRSQAPRRKSSKPQSRNATSGRRGGTSMQSYFGEIVARARSYGGDKKSARAFAKAALADKKKQAQAMTRAFSRGGVYGALMSDSETD